MKMRAAVALLFVTLALPVHAQSPAPAIEPAPMAGKGSGLEPQSASKGSGTDSKGSGTESKGSGTDSKGSGTESKGSGTHSKGSGTESKGSGTEMKGSGTGCGCCCNAGKGSGSDAAKPARKAKVAPGKAMKSASGRVDAPQKQRGS